MASGGIDAPDLKFGVEIHLDISKRLLSLKLKQGVHFQLHGRDF